MLPADVVALHRIADGVDLELWNEEALVPPRLAPGGPEFIDLARSAAVAVGMRDAAVASSRTMGTEPDSLWPPHLGLAYPMWPDDCIAVDTQLSVGELWVVRWEAVDIRPLQHDLAWVFQRATEDLERLECVWDPDERILRFNEDLADELPPFPN